MPRAIRQGIKVVSCVEYKNNFLCERVWISDHGDATVCDLLRVPTCLALRRCPAPSPLCCSAVCAGGVPQTAVKFLCKRWGCGGGDYPQAGYIWKAFVGCAVWTSCWVCTDETSCPQLCVQSCSSRRPVQVGRAAREPGTTRRQYQQACHWLNDTSALGRPLPSVWRSDSSDHQELSKRSSTVSDTRWGLIGRSLNQQTSDSRLISPLNLESASFVFK